MVGKAQSLVGRDHVRSALDTADYKPVLKPAMQFVFGSTLLCDQLKQAQQVSSLAHIHYSNCFIHKCNSCSCQPERHISSVGMEVYNSLKEIAHVHHEILIFKNHSFPYILYCGGQGCPPQYKMYEKAMIFIV